MNSSSTPFGNTSISFEVSKTPQHRTKSKEPLHIQYEVFESPLGDLLAAQSPLGLCYLGFVDAASILKSSGEEDLIAKELKSRFPHATFTRATLHLQEKLPFFPQTKEQVAPLSLHLIGTSFQIRVWEQLLQIPFGKTTSYSAIAKRTGASKAQRAVGSAIGKNPISILVPCHRVLRSDGKLGGYYWGLAKKEEVLRWEATQF